MADDKKGFLLRLPPELFEQVRAWAEQEMRSINGQIEFVLREALRRRSRGPEPPTGTDQAGD
ncbi:MAG: Arc family DNA-binding protein [Planctomycetes bacterium]|nr:Arc family DNA-binding protein [Planctomycetota bacterium]